jgi:hypothetical protein
MNSGLQICTRKLPAISELYRPPLVFGHHGDCILVQSLPSQFDSGDRRTTRVYAFSLPTCGVNTRRPPGECNGPLRLVNWGAKYDHVHAQVTIQLTLQERR